MQINGSIPTILATVYCPPKVISVFLHELSAVLTYLCSLSPSMILLGDFNTLIDNAGSISTRDFFIMPGQLWFKAIYKFSYRFKRSYAGSCVLFRCNCTISDVSLSDHMLVSFNAQLPVFQLNLLFY